MTAEQLAAEFKIADPDAFGKRFVEFFKYSYREIHKSRRTLLLRLANLSLDSLALERTMKSFGFEPESTAALTACQGTLQGIWSRAVSLNTKQFIANLLLVAATQRPGRDGLLASIALGRLEFPAKNFPGQLLLAILENWPAMARCGNPKCPSAYFLAKRSSQKYCERGECTKYAQRQKSLKWWTENRAKGPKQKSRKEKGKGKK
ncbi:MAG: hypothetical protein ACXVZH_14015 [Terriglobales bacterium]